MMRYVWVCCLLAACSRSDPPSTSPSTSVVEPAAKAATWHGLPLSAGLPPKLSQLTFGMDGDLISGKLSGLLSKDGLELSPTSKAKVKLSADGTLRYLHVVVQAPQSSLNEKWPNARVTQIDNRRPAKVWFVPEQSLQIQQRGHPNGFKLTYLKVTPIKVLVGMPNDAGNTFASLIGKPISVAKQQFVRMEKTKSGDAFHAWTSPVIDETVSLNVHIRKDPKTNLIDEMDVFLRDDENSRFKDQLEVVTKRDWKPGASPNEYVHNRVRLRFGHIPRLTKKRANYPFTLHFSRVNQP